MDGMKWHDMIRWDEDDMVISNDGIKSSDDGMQVGGIESRHSLIHDCSIILCQ
jgi:hypothetical protein